MISLALITGLMGSGKTLSLRDLAIVFEGLLLLVPDSSTSTSANEGTMGAARVS